ncbi:hypothetical protein FDJ19_gp162 [Vibrio phage Ceto]|uniref:Uncharacterized protein n=1 Tax=Vibrio phage Ceto TaxID=2570300 RepID=A0A2H5BGL5_9CAUD|nr:hypothetical protein FDJ19_gp162 [Vibrio phage Ceto]AUG85136.1 hypothetical protein CETO_154 [Vibrio phage Ceto]
MAKEEFEKAANDYDKPELVYAVGLMLNLHDMPHEVNKLSKKALWRIFDGSKERGNAFANLEDDKRRLEREVLELRTRAEIAEKKVKKMESNRGKRTKARK